MTQQTTLSEELNKLPRERQELIEIRASQIHLEEITLRHLREKLGLANPTLDHPLMNSALGQLPPEQAFACDPLVTRVVARMKSHGFDEQEVYEKVYFGR